MATAAILPVKRFDQAKQRLGEALGAPTRAALAAAMFADVLAQIQRAATLDADPGRLRRAGRAEARRRGGRHRDRRPRRQGAVAGRAVPASRAQRRTASTRALLVPGRLPAGRPRGARPAAPAAPAASRRRDRARPPRHRDQRAPARPVRPVRAAVRARARSRATSSRRRTRGWQHIVTTVPSLGLDVDTGDDLDQLVRASLTSHGRAPRTRGVLSQIGRISTAAA